MRPPHRPLGEREKTNGIELLNYRELKKKKSSGNIKVYQNVRKLRKYYEKSLDFLYIAV